MVRSSLLMLVAGASIACAQESRDATRAATLSFTARAPREVARPGRHELTAAGGTAILYVPPSYRADRATPLVVLLHGAGHDAAEWLQAPLLPVYDAQDAVILSVSSSGPTWDLMRGGFGPDVRRIDAALAAAFERVNVDTARIALGGFSDGASYALSLGLTNGTRFNALLAFAPGYVETPVRRGKPRVFVAHGIQDQVLPIAVTSRVIRGDLDVDGYPLTYKEFTGRHGIYVDVVREALTWLATPASPPRP